MSKSNTFATAARLDSDLLRTFLAVVESGSFSGAAGLIHRSQSAVSLQIKQLESTLGQPVFERRARGAELTPAGEKLRPIAQRVVGLLDETLDDLRADPLRGSLRIGIPDEYGHHLLAGVIARFSREHPLVELEVRCSLSAGFPQAVARGELDLAIHAVESRQPGMQLLKRQETCWATSRFHAAELRDPLPVALFDRACWWRDSALASLERAGRRYRIVFTSESETGIAVAIAAGVAVGVIGRDSVGQDFRRLDEGDGFTAMPASELVLEYREGAETGIAGAMGRAIGEAFGQG